MPRSIPLAASVIAATLALTAEASAKPNVCREAFPLRQAVIHQHGRRAPGRNVCRSGVRFVWRAADGRRHHWGVRAASPTEKRRYLTQLRALARPPGPYLATVATLPRQTPAGTLSVGLAPTGLAACIVARESGGNPRATNGQYRGIAQWNHAAWAKMGGTRYAYDADEATYEQQLRVLDSGLRRFGSGDWTPYDGCG